MASDLDAAFDRRMVCVDTSFLPSSNAWDCAFRWVLLRCLVLLVSCPGYQITKKMGDWCVLLFIYTFAQSMPYRYKQQAHLTLDPSSHHMQGTISLQHMMGQHKLGDLAFKLNESGPMTLELINFLGHKTVKHRSLGELNISFVHKHWLQHNGHGRGSAFFLACHKMSFQHGLMTRVTIKFLSVPDAKYSSCA